MICTPTYRQLLSGSDIVHFHIIVMTHFYDTVHYVDPCLVIVLSRQKLRA